MCGMRRCWGRWSFAATTLALLTGVLMIAVLNANADAGKPTGESIHARVVPLGNDPAGPVRVYVQGQWNWLAHNGDCNTDRAGHGVAVIWNDANEPGYPVTGRFARVA